MHTVYVACPQGAKCFVELSAVCLGKLTPVCREVPLLRAAAHQPACFTA
jgi:hypothetical protein